MFYEFDWPIFKWNRFEYPFVIRQMVIDRFEWNLFKRLWDLLGSKRPLENNEVFFGWLNRSHPVDDDVICHSDSISLSHTQPHKRGTHTDDSIGLRTTLGILANWKAFNQTNYRQMIRHECMHQNPQKNPSIIFA